MGDLIQFPNRREQNEIEKLRMMQERLAELSVENEYITNDIEYLQDALEGNGVEVSNILKEIEYLQDALEGNGAEASDILKDFAIMSGLKEPILLGSIQENEEPEVDKTTAKWDEIANKTLDASLKLLETAVQQLKFDFDKPTNEDK